MKLFIKNMVCIRCKMIVQSVLDSMELHYSKVELGEAEIAENLSEKDLTHLNDLLLKFGLELMVDKRTKLIEKIKNVIVEMVHYMDEQPKIKFSVYLSKKLDHDYAYLANVFSETKGISIRHFIILHKIERAKEMLTYTELNVSEIAWQLGFNSVAHMSKQFKKTTGLTPSFFKRMKHKKLIPLESL